MSIPKKKSRSVSVGEKDYRYLIRPMRKVSHPDDKEITLVVQEDCKNPGSPLLLTFDKLSILGGKNWGVGPGDVRKIIQKAAETGWDPSRKGAGYMPKDVIEIVRDE